MQRKFFTSQILMKKTLLFIATLLSALVASAKVINAVPAGDISWYLSQAESGDIIEMADGTYDEAYAITFSVENLTIKAAEGAKPVIALTGEWTSLKLAATTTFEGITFDGGGVAYYPIATEGGNTCTFTFNNCEFKNYQYYAISNNNASTQTNVNSVVVNNCIFHDGGAAIYMNKKAACANLTVQNTTIYNFAGVDAGKAAIHIAEVTNDATFATQTLIDHLTIYNYQNRSDVGAISIANASKTTISNSIIASPEQKWVASYNVATDATIGNCLVHNHHLKTEFASIITNADPMFVDAANANFQLYAESPAVGAGTAGSNLGDPRWGVKAGLRPGSKVLSKAVAAAAPGATITLGDGVYEEASSFDFDKEGLTIVAAEGTKPVIKTLDKWTSLGIAASTTFEGITFDGGNLTKTSLDTKGTTTQTLTLRKCEFKNYTDYNINIESSTAINTINIDNCIFDGVEATKAAIYAKGIVTTCQITNSEFKNYAEFCISASDYYRGRFDNLSINNCLLHDGTVAVYMPKYADAGDIQTCANFSLTNSTIYNMVCTKAVIDIRSNPEDAIEDLNKVVIDHITIYNYDATNGAIYIARTNDMSITNSIIATPEDKGQRALYVYGGTVDNTIHFNGSKRSGNTVYTKCENTDPMFVDAANANFQLYANSPAVGAGTAGSNLGDPRWGVSAKVLGKRIYVTPDEDLRYYVITDPNVKVGDTLVLANGTYNISSTTEFSKEGLVVMADENAKPEIKLTDTGGYASLKLNNGTTFDGITFNGTGISNYLVIANGTDASKFVFNNCEFKNYVYYAISDPWTDNYENGRHVDSILINNCLFHDGGAAINLSKYGPLGKHTCDYFEMKNSTIYNISNTGNAAILVSSNAENTGVQNKVVLDHITMYNYANANYGAIAIRKSSDLQITNSIIANPTSGLYAFYIYGGTINNTLYYNATYDSDATYTACITENPLFVDAANADFTLKYNSPAIGAATDGSDLGDPRWGVEPASVVELGDADNSAAIAANAGNTMDVQINRSFTAVGEWYTICFPFSIPQDQQSKLGTIYTVGDLIAVADGEGVNISIEPISGPTAAYQAYLVKPSIATTNPVFEGVTIETGAPVASSSIAGDYTMEFVGTINAGGQTDGSQCYIGDNGYLYNGVVDILGLRAFFTFTKNGQPAKVRARVVAGTNATTGVDNVVVPEGQVLKVIENGQLIIIRGGEKFNVQGQKL